MFAAPPVIEAEVYAELPDPLRKKDTATLWNQYYRNGAPTDSFLEGPSFDRDGNLYCVDMPYGRIFRIPPNGGFELVLEYDGEPNGLKIHKDGRMFVTDRAHGLITLDLESGKIIPVLDRPWLERFRGLNDLVFASNGDCYFTDQGQSGMHDPTGRLMRLRASGELDLLLNNVPSPNGLVLNLAENLLYLAVTRQNAVWRVPLLPTGGTARVGTFLQLSGSIGGPDGLALDEAGNLLVAHAGLGVVWVFSPLGEPLYRVNSCKGILTTNIAFGGANNRMLYITESESGSVIRATLPTPGRKMYSHL